MLGLTNKSMVGEDHSKASHLRDAHISPKSTQLRYLEGLPPPGALVFEFISWPSMFDSVGGGTCGNVFYTSGNHEIPTLSFESNIY